MFITKLFPGRRFDNLEELTRLTEKRKEMQKKLARRKDILKDLKIVSIEKVPNNGQERSTTKTTASKTEETGGETRHSEDPEAGAKPEEEKKGTP